MRIHSSIFLFFLLTLATTHCALARGFYSWVDEKGDIHYSDQVPPAHSQSGHTVIDSGGQVVNKVPARKTDAQLQRERERAEKEATLRKQKREQQIRDTTLLSTFSSVEELDRIRDQRLKTLDSLVRLGRKKVTKLSDKLFLAEQRRDKLEAADKKVPFQLKENIQVLQQQTAHQEQKISEHHRKSAEIKERFRRDRARFVELTKK